MTFGFIEDPQQVILEIETKRIIVLQKDVKDFMFYLQNYFKSALSPLKHGHI